MTLASRTTQLIFAALLALTVSLAWLPFGVGGQEHHAQMYGSEIEAAHGPAHRVPDPPDMADAQDPCGVDCCMMAQCYPGLVAEFHSFVFLRSGDTPNSAFGAGAFGDSPEVTVPPPRTLLI